MKHNKKIRVGVIYGGESPEHEVSVNTAGQVIKYLDKTKYTVLPIKISKRGQWPNKINLSNLAKKIDLAFIVLHGTYGEDGTIQGLLELLHIPYTFSGVLASSIAMNKYLTQELLVNSRTNFPKTVLLRKAAWQKDLARNRILLKKFGKKIVVKPNNLGSSVAVNIIANTPKQLKAALGRVFKHDREALVQEFIAGREITAPVLGNSSPRALPLIDIITKLSDGGFYDYKAKYATGGSEHIIPAKISKAVTKQIKEVAKLAHVTLGCRGVSRSDFVLSKNGKPYFLEINTIPGMTETSLYPQSAASAGIGFPELLDKIIQLSFQ